MDAFSIHGNIRAPLRRIVSLAPSITEMLFYLGLGGQIVGVTRQCDYPAEVGGKEKVGSFLMPDTGRILEIAPDAVIGLGDLHRHLPETLKNGDTGVIIFDYHTVQDVLGVMEAVASLAAARETALGRVDALQKRVNALRQAGGLAEPVRTFFLISESPIMIPSRRSYQYDALRIAGAAQLSGGYTQYERVTLEEVVYFDPEIVLACGRHREEPPPRMCPDCHSTQPICQRIVEDIAEKPGWRETSAARTGNILPIPCHWLCRPGPRLVEGMESIAGILRRHKRH